MQFSKTLSIFATLWTAVLASPIAEGDATVSNVTIEKRADAGVFLCVDAGFTGRCVHIIQPTGECVNLSSDLNDLVTSVGPDADAGDCRFFFDFNCVDNDGFRHFDASSPGFSNLAAQNPGANDQISSYICFG
ncbi:hypothetical protein CHU98_g7298 [Xylaria longipes]|nr:hypothetical protein CHU98_g7298 [Xylaria longipes]